MYNIMPIINKTSLMPAGLIIALINNALSSDNAIKVKIGIAILAISATFFNPQKNAPKNQSSKKLYTA